jgi:hypothetical protein
MASPRRSRTWATFRTRVFILGEPAGYREEIRTVPGKVKAT